VYSPKDLIWHDLCLNPQVFQELRSLQQDECLELKTLANEITLFLNLDKEFVPSFEHNSRFLLSLEHLYDVTFLVSGKSILAHRAVLAARYPTFAAMFCSGFREVRSEVITVDEVAPERFQEMIQFIYQNKLPSLDEDTVFGVLQCADRFMVDEIKRYVEDFLCDFIDFHTCCDLFLTAVKFHCPLLEAVCMNFMARNRCKLRQRKDFNKLDCTFNLGTEIL